MLSIWQFFPPSGSAVTRSLRRINERQSNLHPPTPRRAKEFFFFLRRTSVSHEGGPSLSSYFSAASLRGGQGARSDDGWSLWVSPLSSSYGAISERGMDGEQTRTDDANVRVWESAGFTFSPFANNIIKRFYLKIGRNCLGNCFYAMQCRRI